jgi:Sec-independent protein translocase protein TatA
MQFSESSEGKEMLMIIGIPELFIIFITALLFLGPDNLPAYTPPIEDTVDESQGKDNT